jgi:hypothetical protein
MVSVDPTKACAGMVVKETVCGTCNCPRSAPSLYFFEKKEEKDKKNKHKDLPAIFDLFNMVITCASITE